MTPEAYVAAPLHHEAELLSHLPVDRSINIFDVGCHDGLDSIRYARLFPLARVYSFEPLPAVFERISHNLKTFDCGNVEPFQTALGARRGQAEFFVSSGVPGDERAGHREWDYGNKSSSLLPPDRYPEISPWLRFDTTIVVETDTLAHFCSDNDIHRIDFMHMDVQGAELQVLKGAGRLLDSIHLIWLEVKTLTFYKDQPLKADVEAFMAANLFRKVKDAVGEHTGDQLYLNSRFGPGFSSAVV